MLGMVVWNLNIKLLVASKCSCLPWKGTNQSVYTPALVPFKSDFNQAPSFHLYVASVKAYVRNSYKVLYDT